MRWGLAYLISELVQWCEIVENPERPSACAAATRLAILTTKS